jgi:outer membrane protein assembly factor BamB
MNTEAPAQSETTESATPSYRPLRTWIPLLLVVAMPVIRYAPGLMGEAPEWLTFASNIAPVLLGILILLWWVTVSRAGWLESFLGLLGMIAAIGLAYALADKTMQEIPPILLITIPMGLAGFAVGAVLMGKYAPWVRTLSAVALAAVGFGYSALTRADGMRGNAAMDHDWRWNPSAEEELLLAKASGSETDSLATDFSTEQISQWIAQPEWPAFRGADRSSRYDGPAINTDWKSNPPELIWKTPVGPGWSSFAVAGRLLFTQEQRGPMEAIVCYSTESGKEVWVQEIESRFDESMGGPGPRATPTIASGSLFALGANGQLMRLNPADGEIVWQVDLRTVADRQPPEWGFSSSPLVVDSLVIVHAGGKGDKGTLAFDIESGDLAWSAPSGDHSYASAQLGELGGEQHVLMLTNKELTLLDPITGEIRLTHSWEHNGYRSLQPQLIDGDSLLLPSSMPTGTRRISVTKNDSGWSAKEKWTSRSLKPDFNDLVVHDGHIYGFDMTIFTCVDLETGDRVWKRGRYGSGQVLLLKQSETLLVVTEKGAIVLLKADPSGHQELARIEAVEGKTWNHPVVVGDRLYVRNAKEAACYRLPLADSNGEEKDVEDSTESSGKTDTGAEPQEA